MLVPALLFGAAVFLVIISFSVPERGDLRGRLMSQGGDGAVAENTILRTIGIDIARRLNPESGSLNEKLVKSGGFYKSADDFHARRMYTALVYFFAGVLSSFVLGFDTVTSLVIVTAAVVYGFFVPPNALNAAINRRRERLLREMGFGLERVSISLVSGASVTDALMGAKNMGSFGVICSTMANDITMGRPIRETIEEIKAIMPDTPQLNEFLEMVRIGMAKGTDVTNAFQLIAAAMRQRLLEEVIIAGHRAANRIAMITSGFVMFSTFIVVLGPAILVLAGEGTMF